MNLTVTDKRIAQMHTPEARTKKAATMRERWAELTPAERRDRLAPNLEVARRVRFECLECGRVMPAGPISRHLKASGHAGKRRLAPVATSKRAKAQRRRWAAMTPDERREATADNIDAAAHARFTCDGCGRESNGSGIVRHQRATGHTGRTRVS
jgi:predicted RNA-binding Zn-ribbon protein involved in translation (DUF1610 family)